jgi:hypothetical protein
MLRNNMVENIMYFISFPICYLSFVGDSLKT